MAYSIFKKYGLDRVHDSFTEDYDYLDTDENWILVDKKSVLDSDGFHTDYCWYTNKDKSKHIFMFGDEDITVPDEAYADWVAETDQEAREWFNSYTGFEDDDSIWEALNSEDVDRDYSGNSDFMNDGFDNIYGNGLELED